MKHHCKNRYPHVAVATIVALFSLAASGARAELKPVFAELKLFNSPATLPTIEVEAEGKDWTAVSTQTLHVTTNYFVSLKNGSITTISATFENSPISQSRHPGGGKRRWGEFHFAIPHSQLGVLKHFAIDACNQKKKSGSRTDETHTAFAVVPFKLFVRAERVGNQSTKTIDGNVQAKVLCKKAPKVLDISHLDVKVDNSTGKCPKNAVVEVGFTTNRGDRIDFTIEHMNQGLQISEQFAQPFLVDGQYVATKRMDLIVDSNTEYVQVRLKDGSDFKRWSASGMEKITCPAFKITSARLGYVIERKSTCPRGVQEKAKFKAAAPGQAQFEIKSRSGLVVHSGTAVFKREGMEYVAAVERDKLSMNAFDSDMMALIKNDPAANSGWVRLKVECPEVLSGTLVLRSIAACRCKAEAAFSVRTNSPGSIDYQLDCTGGRSWSGTTRAQQTDGETYIGIGTKRFNVTNNEQISCALKTRAPLPVKVLALMGHKYECQ